MSRIPSRPYRAAKVMSGIAEGAREVGHVAREAVSSTLDEARGRRPSKDLTKQVGELKLLVIGLIGLVLLVIGYFVSCYVIGQMQLRAALAEVERQEQSRQQERDRRQADAAAERARQASLNAQREETLRREREASEQQAIQQVRDAHRPKLPPLRALRAELVQAQSHAGMDASDAHEVATMLASVDAAIQGCDTAARTGKLDRIHPTEVADTLFRARLAVLSTKYGRVAPGAEVAVGNPIEATLVKLERLLSRVEPKLARVGARAPAAAVAAVAAAKAAVAEARGREAADIDLDVLQARLDELRNASDEIDLLE